MCPLLPISAAALMGLGSAAMGGLQAIATYQGQKEQAAAVKAAAISDYQNKSNEITRRQVQEDDAASQKIGLQSIEEAQRSSEAEVSAATAGVGGVSLDNLMADISRSGAKNRQTISENARMTAQQLQLEKTGAEAEATGRINSTPKPSALGLVAGIGSSALSGYNTYKRMK